VTTHDPAVQKAADQTLFLRHGSLEAETRGNRFLSVIDAAGRIQLSPEAMALFPGRRAVLEIGENDVRITPP
jgi:putative ABC transport system ATP-binding protein